jgi:hypothetical protein
VIGKLGTIDFWFVREGRGCTRPCTTTCCWPPTRSHGLELSDADAEVSEVAWCR